MCKAHFCQVRRQFVIWDTGTAKWKSQYRSHCSLAISIWAIQIWDTPITAMNMGNMNMGNIFIIYNTCWLDDHHHDLGHLSDCLFTHHLNHRHQHHHHHHLHHHHHHHHHHDLGQRKEGALSVCLFTASTASPLDTAFCPLVNLVHSFAAKNYI